MSAKVKLRYVGTEPTTIPDAERGCRDVKPGELVELRDPVLALGLPRFPEWWETEEGNTPKAPAKAKAKPKKAAPVTEGTEGQGDGNT